MGRWGWFTLGGVATVVVGILAAVYADTVNRSR